MSIANNNLDDITYEQLVSDAIKRISSLTNKWTNYNPSDPGITFIELFAFLAEIQIYRLNRISGDHYKKYLKLLGMNQNHAIPAKIDITIDAGSCCIPFYLKDRSKFILRHYYSDDKSTNNNEDNLYAETLDGIWIIPSLKIHKIFTYANGESSFLPTFAPYIFIFGEQPVKDNHFILGLKLTQNKELLQCAEIALFIRLYEEDLPPKGIHGSEKLEDFSPGNLRQVKWQYGVKKTADDKIEWRHLELKNDSTNNLINSGKISFQFSEDLLTSTDIFSDIEGIKRENLSNKNNNDYFICLRCSLSEDDYYPIPPRVSDIIPNTVSAELGSSLTDEYLVNTSSIVVNNNERGSNASNGLPNQIFEIKDKQYLPILRLEGIYRDKKCYGVYVDNKRWEEVDDFDNSNENDNHYVIDRINGVIKFGDGKNGSIPSSGNEIKIIYMYGQPNNFNVPLNSQFAFIQENTINSNTNCNKNNYFFKACNNFSSYGGNNFETLKDAVLRLRKEMKEPFKIVSADDCEKIVKSTPGLRISQVKAIPLPEDNALDVIVAPFTLNNSFNYIANKTNLFLETIKNHLDKHKLITTTINVFGPSYVQLTIRCVVVLSFNSDEKNVQKKIHDELYNFFNIHPSKTSNGWNFGQNVYKSDIYTKLNSLAELDCVRDIQIEANGEPGSFEYKENDVIIAPKYLVMLKDVFILTINTT